MDNTTVFSRNKKVIQEILSVDNLTIDTLEGEFDNLRELSFIHKHVFSFYILLAILSNLIYWLMGLNKRLTQYENDDFLFFSCPDSVFRTKNISLIAGGLKYSMIYLPNMHVISSLYYSRYFIRNKIKAFFPTVAIRDVLHTRNIYRQIERGLQEKNGEEYDRVKYTVSIFILYKFIANRFLNGIDSFKGKCIFEHQKFYFMPFVDTFRKKRIETTMLQHGLFFQPAFDYMPLFCDKVLCCSEREKALYLENDTEEERIKVFGAPLQTLATDKNSTYDQSKYNLLILMTEVDDNNILILKVVLEYIKANYNKILIRMRPRSRKEDIKRLGDVLQGMVISPHKNTIVEDIECCAKIVSFSVDANVEVAKLHKPMVYVWTEGPASEVNDINCATEENYMVEINKLMTEDFYSTFSETKYKEILGETDVNILKARFKEYIESK